MFLSNLLRRRSSAPDRPTQTQVRSSAAVNFNSGLPGEEQLPLVAYRVKRGGPAIEIASANRRWMNETTIGFANRCLPLRIANQAGWFIVSHEEIEVLWDGSPGVNGLTLTKGTMDDEFVSSNFGHGILTWRIPYLFRTPIGYNLYVRGPANWCKDGATPLDGIVETDWAVSTFTMNWKITRPGVPIRFEKSEPICMIFPIARGEIERFAPEIRLLEDEPKLETLYCEWKRSRDEFNLRFKQQRDLSWRSDSGRDWQKHYYLGKTTRGEGFPAHQTALKVRAFRGRV